MKNEPLQIPQNKRWKGVTIYCYKCKTNVSEICKESGKPLQKCLFGDKHIFKMYSYIPGTSIRKTKNLGRDWDIAIEEAIAFEKEIKNNIQQKDDESVNRITRKNIEQKNNRPENLIGVMARYIGYLNNDPEIVPSFRKKIRTKSHISEVERCFKRAINCWKKSGCDLKSLQPEEIDEMIIEKFHKYMLDEMKFSNRTYNKNLSIFTSFYDYLNKREKYNIPNPFTTIQRKPTQTNVDTITKEEYERLLDIIQKKEFGKHTLNTGEFKRYYKEWMRDAVELGLETGRRNEEIARMKFSDIYENEKGVIEYIKVLDLKVNRQWGREGNNAKEIIVPVTESLRQLLLRIGYENNKGNDKYLIGTNEKMTRESITRFLSQSFSHYYNQLGTGKNLTYKSLRKTYISQLTAFMGVDNTRLITKHSGTAVMEQHYLDKKVIALTAKDFKIFERKDDSTNERQMELQDTRAKVKEIQKEKTIER